MMKKLMLCLLSMSLCVAVLAATTPDISISTATMILPQRGATPKTLWTTNTVYANGAYVKNASRYYMCLVAGTSGATAAAAPTHTTGVGTNKGDNVSWFVIERDPRKTWVVQNVSGGDIRVIAGYSVTSGVGFAVGAPKGSFGDGPGDYQGPIYVSSTGSTVNAQEW